jgi:hypothetical protein
MESGAGFLTRRMTIARYLVFCAILPSLMGSGWCGGCCILPDVPPCATEPDDTWYAAPPGTLANGLALLSPGRVYLVTAESTGEAQALLESSPAVPLDAATATRLVGQAATVAENTPYLVRALAREGDTPTAAAFDVRFYNGMLYVGYPTLGRCDLDVPTQRLPLVIFLPTAPKSVYIEIAAAPL